MRWAKAIAAFLFMAYASYVITGVAEYKANEPTAPAAQHAEVGR